MPGPMFPGLQRGLMQQPQRGPMPPQAQQGQPGGWGGMGNGWLAQQGRQALQGMGQQLGQQAWGGMDPGGPAPGTITNPGAGRPGGPDRGAMPPGAQQTQQMAAGYAREQGEDPRFGGRGGPLR